MEGGTGGGSDRHSFRLPTTDATHGTEGRRTRDPHTLPDQGRGDEVAERRPLVLPKVVASPGEPGGRQHDRDHGVPTGHLQPHQGTPDGMGMHGGPIGPLGVADHRPPAPSRHPR